MLTALKELKIEWGIVVSQSGFALLRRNSAQFSSAAYDDPGRKWYHTAFSEYFAFMYDTHFYDRHARRYRIDELIEMGKREFGGFDCIVIWNSYPRLGIDERNQFDYYRDMPGGLPALKALTDRAHELGVRILLNYTPWDTDTRREGVSDGEALSEIIQKIGADGVFLDTMSNFDKDYQEAISRRNPHAAYDPEGMPSLLNAQSITGSWLQLGDGAYDVVTPPNLLLCRWLEPRNSLRAINRGSGRRSAGRGRA